MKWDQGLTGQALQIAQTTNSPVWVAAGPGTGKTFALMRRLARLLEVDRAAPERILVCTFTRTAAGDLARAVANLMQQEAEGVADFIKAQADACTVIPGNVLVLAPRREFGYLVRDELRNRGVSAHSFFSEELLEGDPKDGNDYQAQRALALLLLLADPEDRVALRCWCGFGSHNLNGDALVDAVFPGNQEWAKPLAELKNYVEEKDFGSRDLIDAIRRHITQPELPANVDYVRVMSLHKSKGLTADMVVIVGCLEGLTPFIDYDASRAEQTRSLEEQRRLFYVAITRTKNVLVLSSITSLPTKTAHRMRARVGQARRRNSATIASRFIGELGRECPVAITGDAFLGRPSRHEGTKCRAIRPNLS